MSELHLLNKKLVFATKCEDVFGPIKGEKELRDEFRKLIKIAHVDAQPQELKGLAEETFKLLEKWKKQAQNLIDGKVEDKKFTPFQIKVRNYNFTVVAEMGQTSVSDLYACTYNGKLYYLKVAKAYSDNHLIDNEIKILKNLGGNVKKYIPSVYDTLVINRKKATIFEVEPEFTYQLSKIDCTDSRGFHPRDAAWIYNRILECLYYSHEIGVINCGILPCNLLINTKQHSLMIIEWGYSIPKGQKISFIDNNYRQYYYKDLIKAQVTDEKLDIVMATQIIHERVLQSQLPDGYLKLFNRVRFRNCRENAGDLREEFGGILKNIYGQPAFHNFVMP